jgi:hypothetical protein
MILQNDSATSFDRISRELISGLPSFLGDPKHASGRSWTRAMKSGLERIGRARDLLVCCYGVGHEVEWLLDLLWIDPKDGHIALAVALEWGESGEIETSFATLLSIKAYRKLLLFPTNKHTGVEAILKRIESVVLGYPYHLVDEEYMAMEVTERGVVRYSFKVPKDGRLESVRFTEMAPALPLPWNRRFLQMVA